MQNHSWLLAIVWLSQFQLLFVPRKGIFRDEGMFCVELGDLDI